MSDDDNSYIEQMYGPRKAPVKARSPEALAKAESRIGKRQIGAWLDEEYQKSFRLCAARRDVSQQTLLEEAIRDLLIKHGEPLNIKR